MKKRQAIVLLLSIIFMQGDTLAFGQASADTGQLPPSGGQLKDNIAIVVSILGFLISAGVAAFNWWSWTRKNLDDARKTLAEVTLGMITTRQKMEEFRLSAKEKYGNLERTPYRIALNDRRQLYLAKGRRRIVV